MDKGIRRKLVESLAESPKSTNDVATATGIDKRVAYNALYQSKLAGKVIKKGDLWTIRSGPPVKPKPVKRRRRKTPVGPEQHFPLDAIPAKTAKVAKRAPSAEPSPRGATPQQQLAFGLLAILDKILRS